MRNENQETVADIVAEVRARAKAWPDPSLVQYDERLADRIEAAAKREREDGAEAAQICGEIGEMVGREAACKDSLQVGNAAAMRKACANIAEYAKTAACHTEDTHLLGYLNQIESWAEDALSAPPRNCDKHFTSERVSADNLERAWRVFRRCNPNVYFDVPGMFRFIDWLFAEAKGE